MSVAPLELMLGLFVLLQVADGWTTHRAIAAGGRELNVLLGWLFERIGVVPALLATKAASIAAVWATAGEAYWWVLLPVNAFYAWVALRNWRLVQR